ncbi:hypothetical protein EDD11_009088 [Mortierella claussenii]|nr:hypothetical protein EDD11_009088 [Mortierella claussenii]
MNTVRTPSRSSNISSTSASNSGIRVNSHAPPLSQQQQPRKAKVASMAQMDISSISLTNSPINKSNSISPPPRTGPSVPTAPSRPALKIRSSGSVPTTSTFRNLNNSPSNSNGSSGSVVRVSNGGNHVGVSGGSISGNNSTFGRRMAAPSSRPTSSVSASASLRRSGGSAVSFSSDDGTLSDDSVDDGAAYYGGLQVNNVHRKARSGSSVVSGVGSIGPSSGVKIAPVSGSSTVRPRNTSSSVSTGASGHGGTITKPMRIAAGAAIRVDATANSSSSSSHAPIPSFSVSDSSTTFPQSISVTETSPGTGAGVTVVGSGVLSTSLSSSTSSISSISSWVSNQPNSTAGGTGGAGSSSSQPILLPPPLTTTTISRGSGGGGGDDAAWGSPGGHGHVTSPTFAGFNHQNINSSLRPPSPSQSIGSGPGSASAAGLLSMSQPVVRTSKSIVNSATSGAGAAAAAAKLAEDNRRQEEAARTRRKIADLEISNASLLQINQTLEATVRKQAAQVQELKIRMQSAQFGGDLSLLTTDLDLSSVQDPLNPHYNASSHSNTHNNPETAVIIQDLTETERQADLTFRRLCMTIEQMIFEAKQAVDKSSKPPGVKVLSPFDMHEKEAMEDDGAEEEYDLDGADQSLVMNEDDDDLKAISRSGSRSGHTTSLDA